MTDKIAVIVNSLLYILNKFEGRTIGKHQLFKILYFAEKKHLAKYGKPITEDVYIAMEYGPVPSESLDIINYTKNNSGSLDNSIHEASNLLNCVGRNVIGLSEPDTEWLSNSEMLCLDESFNENKSLSFGQLTDKSHDSAWHSTERIMENIKIAEAGGANESMLNYIQSKDELKRLVF